MFVPKFKILGQVVAEKSLTKKKSLQTHTQTHGKSKNYIPLYTSYTGDIIKGCTYKITYSTLANCPKSTELGIEFMLRYIFFLSLVRYVNYLVFIFMKINENIKNKRKLTEK